MDNVAVFTPRYKSNRFPVTNPARGDVIAIKNPDDVEIARGLANYSSFEARLICCKASSAFEQLLGYTGEPEMVHRTNLTLTRE